MNTTFRFVCAIVIIACFSVSSNAQRQTKLYIDDGNGNFSVIQAASGGGTFTLPGSANPLTFPATNAAGVLTNPGNGVLTWSPGGGGSGTVTNFTAGTLSPIFTTSVATSATTPGLTFTLTPAGAHTFFGNFTGGSVAPSFSSPTLASADFVNQGSTTTVLHGNGSGNPQWNSVSLTADISGTLAEGNGGTNQSTYTKGDILYASATNTLSTLPVASNPNGSVLTLASGVPSWGASSGGGNSFVFTGAAQLQNDATLYYSPSGFSSASIIVPSMGTPMPTAITIDAIYLNAVCRLTGTTSNVVTLTIYVDGSPTLATTNVTLPNTATVGESFPMNITPNVAVSLGHLVQVQVTQSQPATGPAPYLNWGIHAH